MRRLDVVVLAARRSDYCLVIPVLNEGRRFQAQLARIQQLGLSLDVIVADGGSNDGSVDPDALRSLNVRALVTKRGTGRLGTQLREAYAWSLEEGYAGIVTMDGNGKDGVEALPLFIAALSRGVDYAQGSRYAPGGQAVNTPRERALAVKYVHAPLISLSGGKRLTDTTNGFRAYSRRYLLDPRVDMFRDEFDRYALLFYLSVRAGQLGYRVEEVPVRRSYPADGTIPTKIAGVRGKIAMLHELAAVVAGSYHPAGSAWRRWRPTAFGVLAALMLFVSSWGDLTRATTLPFVFAGIPSERLYSRDYFDWTSQMLVWNFVAIERETGRYPARLMRVDDDDRAYETDRADRRSPTITLPPLASVRLTPYTSGFGLQGYLASLASGLCIPAERKALLDSDLPCVNGLYTFAAAAALGVVLAWIVANLGLVAGLCSLLFSVFSIGINVVAPNVYWAFPLFILPLAFMCAICWTGVPRARRTWAIAGAVLVLLFTARLLGGFEFASVYVLAATLPGVFHAVKARASGTATLAAGVVLTASIVALAIAATVMKLVPEPPGTLAGPLDPLSLALRYLSYHGENPGRDLLKMLGAGSFGGGSYVQLPTAVLLLVTASLLYRFRHWLWRRGAGAAGDQAAAAYALLAAAAVASLSWAVLMPMHFLQNTIYSSFNFAFPMFLFMAAFAGYVIGRWSENRLPAAMAPTRAAAVSPNAIAA